MNWLKLIVFTIIFLVVIFVSACVFATLGDAMGLWDTPTWVNCVSVFVGGGSPVVGIIAAKN